MAEPFIGEIRMFGGNFAPVGWAFCDGQILAIANYDALFALIGTTYGGDGQTTFNLPDLRGRIPLHSGGGFVIGQLAGSETVTVTNNQLPQHTHSLISNSAAGTTTTPANGNIVAGTSLNPYLIGAPDTTMGNQMIGATVGNQPHDNIMPFQCLSFIIALEGIFPSQN